MSPGKPLDAGYYVVDEDRVAVVAGAFEDQAAAQEEADDRAPGHIVASARVLELIMETSTRPVRWENGDHDVDVVTDGGQDEPVAAQIPDREDYPDPSLSDLKNAIEAALADADSEHPWSHHRRGRYTAHRTYTEHSPDMKPGDKHVAIRVTECEREIILDVVEEHAESVIEVLDHRLAAAEPEGGDAE